jgi:hypothetical protein
LADVLQQRKLAETAGFTVELNDGKLDVIV